jgi:hypothetical protein
MPKGTIQTYLEKLPHHSPWSTEETHEKPYVKTVGVFADIRTGHLSNTPHKHYRLRLRSRSGPQEARSRSTDSQIPRLLW